MFNSGDIVILKGKTNHGKQVVNRDGETFLIQYILPRIFTSKHVGCQGPFASMQPNKNQKNIRWVSLTDDPDFDTMKMDY